MLNGRRRRRQARGSAGGAPDNWRRVEEEYADVVSALNARPVSATVRSAEGIALYPGIDSHNANGGMRKLAAAGHQGLLARIREMIQEKTAEKR
jgi:hypothetical protein